MKAIKIVLGITIGLIAGAALLLGSLYWSLMDEDADPELE